MLPTNVPDLLAGQARLVPRAPAIEALERAPLDHQGLVAQVDSFRAELARRGVGRGARVGMVLDTGPEMAVACLGAMAGAACVPLNPEYTRAELEALLRLLRVELLVTQPAHAAARAAARAADLPVLELIPRAGGKAGELELSADARSSGQAELQAPGPDDLALVLHTSGSTARPKVVPLTHRNLLEASSNVVRTLELGRDDRCLSALPMYHVGALVDLLLAPLSVGGAVVVAPDMTAGSFFACLRALRPSWYQGVPTMLQDILHRARIDGVEVGASGLRFVRSVSAPLPPAVLDEFEQRFGVPVIEIYGMTETAGVITSNPLPPGERRPGSVGVSAGPELVIVDGAGNAVAAGRLGEVCVRGASVTAGYERAPAASGSAGPEEDTFIGDWLRTGDEGRLDADGYLYLTGRIKELVNRGGEKIAPREVDEVVLAHPGVADAAAFALPHETLGEEVALAVVAREGQHLGAAELVAFCAERLAHFKVPRKVFLVDALPRTVGGKLQRGRLTEAHAGPVPEAQPRERLLPRSELERTLAGLWCHALGLREVGIHDDFFELGGDSLKAAAFIAELQERAGWRLPASALYDGPTLAELAQQIEALAPELPAEPAARSELPPELRDELLAFLSAWKGVRAHPESLLVGWNTMGSKPPLFWCENAFPEFAQLARHLGPDQPVFGMRSMYGLERRSEANTAAVVRIYADEMIRLQVAGPFALGGFCAGGAITLQVAKELIARGREVKLLCLLDWFEPCAYDGRVALFFCAPGLHSPYFRRLPAGRAPGVRRQERSLSPGRLLENAAFGSRYYNPYLKFSDSAGGWGHCLRGPVNVHLLDGTHTNCHEEGRVQVLAELLARELEAADAGVSVPEAPPPRAAGRAEFEFEAPLLQTSRSVRTLEVDLTNRGARPWPASADGGPLLCARWLRNGWPGVSSDSGAELPRALQPGSTVHLELPLNAPTRPGRWQLEVDLLDPSGARWSRDSAPARTKTVVVVPGPALWPRAVERFKERIARAR